MILLPCTAQDSFTIQSIVRKNSSAQPGIGHLLHLKWGKITKAHFFRHPLSYIWIDGWMAFKTYGRPQQLHRSQLVMTESTLLI